MQEITGCCLDAVNLPPLRLDKPDKLAIDSGMDASPESVFFRRCSLCHRTNERFPPNFLAGIGTKYVQIWPSVPSASTCVSPCGAAGGAPDENAHAPFRPSISWASNRKSGGGIRIWRRCRVMRKSSCCRRQGRAPELEALVARGYENLRPCLAQAE